MVIAASFTGGGLMKNFLRMTFVVMFGGLLAVGCKSDIDSASADASRTADNKAADNRTSEASSPIRDVPPAPAPARITIPTDTPLPILLMDRVSSDDSAPGDGFKGTLAEPVQVDGKTVLEKGTVLQGRVVDASKSGRVKGRASLSLKLTGIVRGSQTVPIQTVTYVAVAKSEKKKDAAVIAGGTGVGAAIGAIAGGGKGAAIGAAVGGGAGTGEVLATKGKDVDYPPETRVTFKLAAPVVL